MFCLYVYIFISSRVKYLGETDFQLQIIYWIATMTYICIYLSKSPSNLMMLTCFYDTHCEKTNSVF